MSDAATATQNAPQAAQGRQPAGDANRVSELRVSGNLMRLETGLYCIVNKAVAHADAQSGLPGVRLSPAPGIDSRPEQVEITAFRADGWLSGFGDAALVRVYAGPAHVLVTVYQSPNHPELAPNIQVVKLLDQVPPQAGAARQMAAALPLDEAQGSAHVGGAGMGALMGAAAPEPAAGPQVMDMVAHIQGLGDVGALLGERLGEVGSKRWIEGFAIAPTNEIAPGDIEYQAVLGRGWLSPWVEGGEFCGSRGMALPVLGLRVRLRGDAARDYDVSYGASFTDGTQSGLMPSGASCESESLAPMESFQVNVRRRGQAPAAPRAAAPRAAAPAMVAPQPEPIPAPMTAPTPAPKAAPKPTAKAPTPAPKAAPKPAAKAAAKPAPEVAPKPAPRRR